MKAISAGGRVSPVSDLLPRALPAFYVLAPDYIPLLLKPVLNMTLSWPMDYAIHDIGKRKFPNVLLRPSAAFFLVLYSAARLLYPDEIQAD